MEKFKKSFEQLKKFLDQNSKADIEAMMEDIRGEGSIGVSVHEYFQNFEDSYRYDEMINPSPCESFFEDEWNYEEAPISVYDMVVPAALTVIQDVHVKISGNVGFVYCDGDKFGKAA